MKGITFRVVEWDHINLVHVCLVDGETSPRRFNLQWSGIFQHGFPPLGLIGGRFTMDEEQPFISIAVNVQRHEPAPALRQIIPPLDMAHAEDACHGSEVKA